MNIDISAINVRGLNSIKRVHAIGQWVRLHMPDIMCFTETKLHRQSNPNVIDALQKMGTFYYSCATVSAAGGVAILICNTATIQWCHLIHVDKNSLIIILQIGSMTFNLVILYLTQSTTENRKIMNTINSILRSTPFPTLMVGDFNLSYSQFNSQCLPFLSTSLMSGEGLFDRSAYSYYTTRTKTLIDLIYFSPEFQHCLDARLLPVIFSDHFVLEIKIDIPNSNTVPQWNARRTVRLLTRNNITPLVVSQAYIKFHQQQILSLPAAEAFSLFTNTLTNLIIQTTCKTRGPLRLLQELDEIANDLQYIPSTDQQVASIMRLKTKYKYIQDNLIEYLSVKRAKNYICYRDCWTREYIRWALGSSYKRRVPDHIVTQNKTYLGQAMLEKIRRHYQEVLQPAGSPTGCRRRKRFPTKTSHGISKEDIINRIRGIPDKTHPGIPGIPKFLLLHLSNFTAPIILNMINLLSNDTHHLPGLCHISLVPFIKNRDKPMELDNLRPISMIPLTIKIIEGIIKEKVQETILKKISSFQFGKKGSSTADAIARFRLVVDFIRKKRQRRPIAVQLDFAKAFDAVRIDVLLLRLMDMQVAPAYLQIMENLLYNREICISLDGRLAPGFTPSISIPQGSPLSALYFVTYINPLLTRLEAELTGIKIPLLNETIRHLSYIDDVTVFLSSIEELPVLNNILKDFEQSSGLFVNRQKSAIWSILSGNIIPGPFSAAPQPFLGFQMNLPPTIMRRQIQDRLLIKIQNTVDRLKIPRISLLGKVSLLNSLILPKIIYYLAGFSPTEDFHKKIETICGGLCRGDSKTGISLGLLQKPKELDGLGLHCLRIADLQRMHNSVYSLFKRGTSTQCPLPFEKIEPTDRPPPNRRHIWLQRQITILLKRLNMSSAMLDAKLKYWEIYKVVFPDKTISPRLLGIGTSQIARRCKYWQMPSPCVDFLIKINLGALPVRIFLIFKRGMDISPYCSFCQEEESIAHFLSECRPLQLIRQTISKSPLSIPRTATSLTEALKSGIFAQIRSATFINYALWRARNTVVFQQEDKDNLHRIFSNILKFLRDKDYKQAGQLVADATWQPLGLNISQTTWQPLGLIISQTNNTT